MANNKVELDLLVNAKQADKGFADFSKNARAAINGVAGSIFNLKTAVAGAVAGLGIAKTIASVTEAASRQDDAINSLNTALRISGEFTKEASAGMQAFASQIQQTTKFGDELILEQLALAKAFGATNDQAKEVTRAAVELAAATGKSLEEATRQVSKTLGGFAGELGEVNPAIKALTAEQLKAGGAAKVLIEQFGGSAAAQLNTFSGALAQTTNTFGDLQEEIGFTITRNPVVIKAIGLLNEAFQELIKITKNNQGDIANFIGSIVKGIVSTIPVAVRSMAFLVKAFEGVTLGASSLTIVVAQLGKALLSVDIVNDIVKNLVNGFDLLKIASTAVFEAILQSLSDIIGLISKIPGVGDAFDGVRETLDGFRESVTEARVEMTDAFGENTIDTEAVTKSLTEIEQQALDSGASITEFSKGLQTGIETVAVELDKVAARVQDIDASKLVGPNDLGGAESTGRRAADGFLDKVRENFADILAAATSAVFEGKKGVAKLFTEGAAAAVDVFIPGFGQAAKPIFDALTKGPEFVKSTIEGFVQGLPEILDNIAQALPVLVTTLAENIDEVIIAIVKATPAIARALAIEVPLALADPKLWIDVARSLVIAVAEEITGAKLEFSNEKLKEILNNFGENFNKAFNGPGGVLDNLSKPFRPLINALDNLANALGVNTSGGSGGFLGQQYGNLKKSALGTSLGLATGGTIPPGFPNDTFPASLTSGEVVVPRDDVTELRRFLKQERQPGKPLDMSETNALLAQLVNQGGSGGGGVITLNEDGLTQLLLDFSRRNERTVA